MDLWIRQPNELVQAKEFDASSTLVLEADYKYDVYSNRIEQDVMQSGTTTVQRYALDGWNPAKSNPVGNEDFDVWADLNGSSSLTTRYLRGDKVDQLLGRVDVSGGTGTAYWTLTDSQGSVRDVIDNTGVVKDSISYDAFGNIDTNTELDSAYRGRYTWTGRELDVETGLQYNRARYYDSTTGRWISQDPMGFDAGDSNLYRYVNNAPTNATDPSGLQTFGGAGPILFRDANIRSGAAIEKVLVAAGYPKGQLIEPRFVGAQTGPFWYQVQVAGGSVTLNISTAFTPQQALALAKVTDDAVSNMKKALTVITQYSEPNVLFHQVKGEDGVMQIRIPRSLANIDANVPKGMFTNDRSVRNLFQPGETVKGYYTRMLRAALRDRTVTYSVGSSDTGPAYMKWNETVERPDGNTIYFNPMFFEKTQDEFKAGILIHEWARILMIGPKAAENSGSLDDVYRWNAVVGFLSARYDQLKKEGIIK